MSIIYKAIAVDLALLKSMPPHLAITVYGQVSSGGWTAGTLSPVEYVMPPADGIQDFDFIATPPTGVVIQVVLPITAHYVMQNIPSWLKGVRVHSQTNTVEAKLVDAAEHAVA